MQSGGKCDNYLNLRGVPCPVNYVRCKLALEKVSLNSKGSF